MLVPLTVPSTAQVTRLPTFVPRSHGRLRVNDRRVLSGVVSTTRNRLRWRDAPEVHGLAKALHNCFTRRGRIGAWAQMLTKLVYPGHDAEAVMIDAIHLS